LITKWNETNPTQMVRFIEGPFRALAAKAGHPDTIDSATFFEQIGLTKEQRSWTQNKDFLRFVFQNARQALADGGLTRHELQNVINSWNEMQKDKPLSVVVNNQGDFERISNTDGSKTASGQKTISTASITRALGIPVMSIDNKEFVEFALTKGSHLAPGGFTKDEIHRVIELWNQTNPTKPIALTDNGFTRMASIDGSTDSINSNELLNAIGLSRTDRMWGNNQAFLKFLDTDPEAKQRSSDGLTKNDITYLIQRWNTVIHRAKPLEHVIEDPMTFEKLARKDNNLQSISRDEISTALGRNHILNQGKLENFRGIWDRLGLPFTYESLMETVNKGYTYVSCRDNRPMELGTALNLTARKTGVTDIHSTWSQAQVEQNEVDSYNPFNKFEEELEQRQQARNRYIAEENSYLKTVRDRLGRELTPQEEQHYRLAHSYDLAAQQIVNSFGSAYTSLTGLDRQDAPYAFAALDFLASIPASIVISGKQLVLARSDLPTYVSTAVTHAPETFSALLQSFNALEPGISGEERFGRSLNALTIVIGALKFGPKSNPSAKMQASRCGFPATEAEFFSVVNESLKGREVPPHLKSFLEKQGYKLDPNVPSGIPDGTVVNIIRDNTPTTLLDQYRSVSQNMVAKELRFLAEDQLPPLRKLDRTISNHQLAKKLEASFATLKEVLSSSTDEASFLRLINSDSVLTGNGRPWYAHHVTIGSKKYISICPLGHSGQAPRIYIRFDRDPSGLGSKIAEIIWDPEHNKT
jgi:hypothetical protein